MTRFGRRPAFLVVAAAAAAMASAPSVAVAQQQPERALVVSASADRTNAKPLHGAIVSASAPVYVYVSGSESRRLVKFYLDDVHMDDLPLSTDKKAPFDLAGTASTGAAKPFSMAGLSAGTHALTARVKLASGTNRMVTARFTVASPADTTAPTPSAGTATPVATSTTSTSTTPSATSTTADASVEHDGGATGSSVDSSSARPTTTTTGVTGSLRSSGSITVSKAGAVIENLDVRGSITVRANDVTIRNVRVRSSGALGINVAQGVHGTLIDHVDIEMSGDATAAIGGLGDHHGSSSTRPGHNVTVRYSHLHGNGDGIKAVTFGLYEHNYIRMRRPAGSTRHIDGIQSSGRSSWTARYNWVDQPYSAGFNSAIFVQAYTGTKDVPSRDITITDNWVNGGLYTIQTEDGKNGNSGLLNNIRINDNVFYRDYKYGAYRPRGDIRGNGGHWAYNGHQVPTGSS